MNIFSIFALVAALFVVANTEDVSVQTSTDKPAVAESSNSPSWGLNSKRKRTRISAMPPAATPTPPAS